MVVISQNEPRMKAIKLSEVCFLNELSVLLGISRDYARKLADPPKGVNREWYERQRFPRPFYTSPSGIRVWWLRDVRAFALGLRSYRTGARKGRGIPLLDAPEMLEDLMGL